ncbi:hypothetical protein FA95DRAFT_1613620 [Auriscalpium vulgare]|uniref:Uncharacterized protein n=1 Tax=Auriscalpium vulgare TaxID=40419 RepID=A0ACB8R2N9_9AGAM|nr:hypothetical protein FA95DRAFT_1613620 [Auriscalpium vulgare]
MIQTCTPQSHSPCPHSNDAVQNATYYLSNTAPSFFGSSFNPGEAPGHCLDCNPPPVQVEEFVYLPVSPPVPLLTGYRQYSDYRCCRHNFSDLHALVDHVEGHHLDRYTRPPLAPPPCQQQPRSGYFDPDDMETEASSFFSSPPPILAKPFRCPTFGCTKTYKQAHGLRYHTKYGSCKFPPPRKLKAVASMLAEKGTGNDGGEVTGSDGGEGMGNMMEGKMSKGGLGEYQWMYQNMDGIYYEYQHEHGGQGLQLLASGQHELLEHTRSLAKISHAATPQQPHSSHTAHHAIPQQQQQQQQHSMPARVQVQHGAAVAGVHGEYTVQQQQQFYVGRHDQQGGAYGYQVPVG